MGSQKTLSRKTPSEAITSENKSASNYLSNKGYEVYTDASYPDGAFYAKKPEYNKKGEVIPRHEQEIDFVTDRRYVRMLDNFERLKEGMTTAKMQSLLR